MERNHRNIFNLENRNYTSKVIHKLVSDEGTEYTEIQEIPNLQKEFYQKLYSQNQELNDKEIETLIGENSDKLSDAESNLLEGELKYFELLQALKNMKNEKSPGQDGFTVELFKFFWVDFGQFILRSLNYAYKEGSLCVTQKMGIITCLPKPDKK